MKWGGTEKITADGYNSPRPCQIARNWRPSMTKLLAGAVILLTILNGVGFAWDWPGQVKARERKQAEAEEIQREWARAEAVCGPHPELRADVNAMMRQIDADTKELQNAKDSSVAIRQIERNKIREAQAERLKAEWEICARSVWDRDAQSKNAGGW